MTNEVDLNSKNIEKILYLDIEGKFLHVKVGDVVNPASDAEVTKIEKKLTELFEENSINCVTFVSHHAMEISIVEGAKK